ncbi:c3h4 type zinc finger protein [Colletotrichum truncatum]|uniref:C3h4 type zinc finger protein n=1 Tax=Colletotrichum truncatum TaxID=5467 RepID=A0ACC3Z5J7_COLTU|nr:c3h4 type zinc finger protein [Colletotrichum truncatum]KAF6795244.1 c3h4 type zinc finger protein [Colletotrichum truncatum]
MDDSMDYIYHHPEQHPSHGQLPYSQQRSRCPYFNRTETQGHPAISPHRSTSHYDPVHASASHWQSQAQIQPHHWQPQMLGHRGTSTPYHRPANSVPEPPYYNHGPVPNFGHALAGYQGPSHDIGGLHAIHPPFPIPQLPPVRYGNPTPFHANSSNSNQSATAPPESAFGHPPGPRSSGHFDTLSPSTAATSTQPPSVQDSSEANMDSQSSNESAASESSTSQTQAPASTNIQFGSSPPSSAPQHNNPTFAPSSYRPNRPVPGGEIFAATPNGLPLSGVAHARSEGSSTGSSSSSNNSAPVAPAAERRRVPTTARRTLSRRQSPPSDREYDHEGEMRMLEHFIVHTGNRLMGHDIDDNHIRAAQFLRGSVSTKMVASTSAIQSLQSVATADLSESERTCVICYNEFGVETPEGVKEAPLRLPKCKHVFGDHCIKKWFEESDSCPYCRSKVPSEPRMTSTNSAFNNLFRTRGIVRERDSTHGQDESSRNSAAASTHGERRSPPADSGETRRRIRPRHGSFRGPGSPPFSGGRPGSFGGASSATHERRAHALVAGRTHTSNAPSRMTSGGPPQFPFPVGNITHYHIPSFGVPSETSPAAQAMPPYVPPVPHGFLQAGQNAPFSNLNRNSLPAPPPGNWHSGSPTMPEDMHRRMMVGDNNAVPQTNGPPHWGPQ